MELRALIWVDQLSEPYEFGLYARALQHALGAWHTTEQQSATGLLTGKSDKAHEITGAGSNDTVTFAPSNASVSLTASGDSINVIQALRVPI